MEPLRCGRDGGDSGGISANDGGHWTPDMIKGRTLNQELSASGIPAPGRKWREKCRFIKVIISRCIAENVALVGRRLGYQDVGSDWLKMRQI